MQFVAAKKKKQRKQSAENDKKVYWQNKNSIINLLTKWVAIPVCNKSAALRRQPVRPK